MARRIHRQDDLEAQACKGQEDTRSPNAGQEAGEAGGQEESGEEDREASLQTLARKEEARCQGQGDGQEAGVEIFIGTAESYEKRASPSKKTKICEAPDKSCSPQSEHDTC